MSAKAQIDVLSEESGNSGRDDYIKSSLSPGEALYEDGLLKSFNLSEQNLLHIQHGFSLYRIQEPYNLVEILIR